MRMCKQFRQNHQSHSAPNARPIPHRRSGACNLQNQRPPPKEKSEGEEARDARYRQIARGRREKKAPISARGTGRKLRGPAIGPYLRSPGRCASSAYVSACVCGSVCARLVGRAPQKLERDNGEGRLLLLSGVGVFTLRRTQGG